MKSFCAAVLMALASITGRGQGTIDFRNTPSTPITTNNLQGTSGLISGAGNYRFGLYVGPFGSSGGSLTLVGLGTNGAIAGQFNGGSGVIAGFPSGTQVSFQVRGWSSFAGNNYDQAFTYATGGNLPLAYLGQSTLGFFTVPNSGSVIIFGTGPGQVGGFELTPIPEPSTYVLSLFGLPLLVALRRGRTTRQKGNVPITPEFPSRLRHAHRSGDSRGPGTCR